MSAPERTATAITSEIPAATRFTAGIPWKKGARTGTRFVDFDDFRELGRVVGDMEHDGYTLYTFAVGYTDGRRTP